MVHCFDIMFCKTSNGSFEFTKVTLLLVISFYFISFSLLPCILKNWQIIVLILLLYYYSFTPFLKPNVYILLFYNGCQSKLREVVKMHFLPPPFILGLSKTFFYPFPPLRNFFDYLKTY